MDKFVIRKPRSVESSNTPNDGMVVYIEQEIFKNIENEVILQHFQKMQKRRMQLSPLNRCT